MRYKKGSNPVTLHLTTLSQEQADYIYVSVEGPYKPERYRC
ncbi:MAG: adenosylhomocysteinase [Ectothiorhodospiraceae bacterium]|nr:adenosylhomocysteinase [Ectothiorhodospiraceae bacterium]